jgi:uncharacterized protein YjdB
MSKYLILLSFLALALTSCVFDKGLIDTLGLNTVTASTSSNSSVSPEKDKGIKAIIIDPTNIVLQTGEEKLLTGTLYFEQGQADNTNINIEWLSEDRSIVDVDKNGKIKAIKQGETGIIAKYKYSNTANRTIVRVVSNKIIEKIAITPNYLNLKVGDSANALATVFLSDGTKNSNIEWSSSDNTIATVNDNGRITTKKIGLTTIVATYKLDSIYKGSVDVNVYDVANPNFILPPQTKNDDSIQPSSSSTTQTPNSVNPNATNNPDPQQSQNLINYNPTPFATAIPTVEPTILPPQNPTPLSTPIPTIQPSEVPYIPANISLSNTNISEFVGNGDNIPNKGETINLKPVFVNNGGASTNSLKVNLTSTSSYAKVSNYYEYCCSEDYGITLNKISAGSNSVISSPSYAYLKLEIDKTTPAGTTIPITYTVFDEFGNSWNISGSIIIK